MVTYAKTTGEDAEVYQVHYDVIVTAMGYSTAYDSKSDARPIPGQPTVKDMVGDIALKPHEETEAPVLSDGATGRLRVVGYATGDAVNVSRERVDDAPSDADHLRFRREEIKNRVSADSPDDRVVEGVGIGTRKANAEMNE